MANLVFFADEPRKEATGPTGGGKPDPIKAESDEGMPAQWQGGHLVTTPVSLTPSTPACNLMNRKYRDGKVQNMQPMQVMYPDSAE